MLSHFWADGLTNPTLISASRLRFPQDIKLFRGFASLWCGLYFILPLKMDPTGRNWGHFTKQPRRPSDGRPVFQLGPVPGG